MALAGGAVMSAVLSGRSLGVTCKRCGEDIEVERVEDDCSLCNTFDGECLRCHGTGSAVSERYSCGCPEDDE